MISYLYNKKIVIFFLILIKDLFLLIKNKLQIYCLRKSKEEYTILKNLINNKKKIRCL